jgi:hypothetical protein
LECVVFSETGAGASNVACLQPTMASAANAARAEFLTFDNPPDLSPDLVIPRCVRKKTIGNWLLELVIGYRTLGTPLSAR